MKKILLIIEREYLTRVRKKSFIVLTLLGPVLIASVILFAVWLGMRDEENQKILIIDETPGLFAPLKSSPQIEYEYGKISLDAAKRLFHDSPYTGILYIPVNILQSNSALLFFKKQPGLITQKIIAAQLENILEEAKMNIHHIEKEQYRRIRTMIRLSTIRFREEGGEEKVDSAAAVVGFIFALFIYLFIFMYGVQVMRGVIEEKSSRIVEIIVSSVKPFQLMLGKITGIALVGITQFALWVALTAILVAVSRDAIFSARYDPSRIAGKMQVSTKLQREQAQQTAEIADLFSGPDNIISRINFPVMLSMFLFYFLCGYLLYSALFAAVGAAVDNEADTQQFLLPLTLPLIFGFIVAEFIIMNPAGSTAFWFSIIPFTSPVVMMVRIAIGVGEGGVPLWEVWLSMALLVAGFLFTTWAAAKIYRTGILLYGKKAGWKEIWKWMQLP